MSRGLEFSVNPNVFCLIFSENENDQFVPIGSGCFFMKHNLVLTAKHVVEDRKSPNSNLKIANGLKSGNQLLNVDVTDCWSHPDIDISLLHIQDDQVGQLEVTHPLFPSHYSYTTTNGFAVAGYDAPSSNTDQYSWKIMFHHVKHFNESQRSRTSSNEFCLEFKAPWIHAGYSGAPILGEGGGVIGVVTQAFNAVEESTTNSNKGHARATSVYPVVESFSTPFQN